MTTCEVCAIQERMDAGADPWAVARLETGYVQLHSLQYYRGYTFFSARSCVREIFELPTEERGRFLHEMSEVAHAVQRAFTPRKMNYEALGNGNAHLHWHLIPRHDDDPRAFAPVWENLDYLRLVWTNQTEPDEALREQLRTSLRRELESADVTIEASFV